MTAESRPQEAPLPSLQHVWATVVPVEDLPGRWVKRVEVPPDGVAVAEDRTGSTRLLEGASPPVGGGWYRLTHPSAPNYAAVGVIKARTLTLHPSVTNLLSADGQLAAADWLVALELTDPELLYRQLIRPAEVIPVTRLALNLAAHADSKVRALAKQYLLQDLQHNIWASRWCAWNTSPSTPCRIKWKGQPSCARYSSNCAKSSCAARCR
jgi:hypothetical protein